MEIIYTKSYDKSVKKLKKHNYEYNNLIKICKMIRNTSSFDELLKLPILSLYNFERLKYELNDFYSFNLCKNGGKIRLIIKPNDYNKLELYLIYISYDHYNDFDIKKEIYYE